MRRNSGTGTVLAAGLVAGAWGPIAVANVEELTEDVKLTASDAAAGDGFGGSVGISGDTVIVGASTDDDDGNFSGSAYVFRRDAGGAGAWGEVTKLTAADADATDQFGVAVAISGDTAIVGAFREGDSWTGAAYLFRRDAGGTNAWGQVAKLVAFDPAPGDELGAAVAIDGDVAVVGASQKSDAGSFSGSAYVFERDAGGSEAWGQTAKLTASDADGGDQFGNAVSVSGDLIIIGAFGNTDDGQVSGSAYIFERDSGGVWLEVAKLTASDADQFDRFGAAVAISGDTAVVGADQNDDGAVYVYRRDEGGPGAWGEVIELVNTEPAVFEEFGHAVAISGDSIVAAALIDVNGNNAGAAYLFERDAGGPDGWGHTARLTASDATALDYFGRGVSVSGRTIVSGANGDDDAGSLSGSAYVFETGGCQPDLDGDGNVGVPDLVELIASWGSCSRCAADLNGDGVVDVRDLIALLTGWGGC